MTPPAPYSKRTIMISTSNQTKTTRELMRKMTGTTKQFHYSPMDLAQHRGGLVVAPSSRQLSPEDEATLQAVLSGKCDYVENDVFKKANAEKQLFVEASQINRPDTSWYHPLMEKISDTSDAYGSGKRIGTVLLTAAQERALFLQFNYCRYRIAQLAKQTGEGRIDPDLGRQVLLWHNRAEAYRDQIAQTNLALVLAMAKRTRMSEVDFADLVSEGNMALLRAIDKFDVARGFKFSTYACRAILKAFSRMGVTHSRYRQLFPTDFDPKYEKSDYMEHRRAEHEDDCVDEVRSIVRENRADLTDIERSVIEHRFALRKRRKSEPELRPLTLEQVGRVIGVTKERVRQIQNKALNKIRDLLEEEFLN